MLDTPILSNAFDELHSANHLGQPVESLQAPERVLGGIEAIQCNGLIADQASAPIHRPRTIDLVAAALTKLNTISR